MKKLFVLLLTVFFSVASFAQEFTISGEAKTGVIWQQIEDRLPVPLKYADNGVRLGSKDDAGSNDGRFRINMEYTSASGNLGFKARLNWENFNNGPTDGPHWTYGFGYGNFFDNQLTLSLGKLGASPWGSGGPEMWRELEITRTGGIRFEWKPNFVPGDLNIGFVLNSYDDIADAGLEDDREPNLIDFLSETVLGASYKNDWFMARVAYRFDGELDQGAARSGLTIKKEGTKLVYRLEEYALKEAVPDMSVWALGEFMGIGSEAPEDTFSTRNWLFFQYAPDDFTAQVRFGLEATGLKLHLFVRPSFSYKFFDGLLVPGIDFSYANDFGEHKIVPDSKYLYFEIRPKIQVNFAQGAYVAIEYSYKLENKFGKQEPPVLPEQQTQWINLRAGITF